MGVNIFQNSGFPKNNPIYFGLVLTFFSFMYTILVGFCSFYCLGLWGNYVNVLCLQDVSNGFPRVPSIYILFWEWSSEIYFPRVSSIYFLFREWLSEIYFPRKSSIYILFWEWLSEIYFLRVSSIYFLFREWLRSGWDLFSEGIKYLHLVLGVTEWDLFSESIKYLHLDSYFGSDWVRLFSEGRYQVSTSCFGSDWVRSIFRGYHVSTSCFGSDGVRFIFRGYQVCIYILFWEWLSEIYFPRVGIKYLHLVLGVTEWDLVS
jgi:hypothetical protein